MFLSNESLSTVRESLKMLDWDDTIALLAPGHCQLHNDRVFEEMIKLVFNSYDPHQDLAKLHENELEALAVRAMAHTAEGESHHDPH